jgi:hypothetical protein
MKKLLLALLLSVTTASIAGNVLLYNRYSSRRPLLRTADGVEVTRKEYQDIIDYKFGKQVLNKLTYEKIIRHAAEKAGVMPTEKDVDARLEGVRRRSPQVLERLKNDPARMAELRSDTLTELALENLRIRDVTVTDAEAKAHLAKNANTFAVPLQVRTTLAVAPNQVDAAAAAKMLRQKIPLDVIARRPRIRVAGVGGWDPDWSLFPPAAAQKLGAAARSLKPGGVTIVPIADYFFILRMDGRTEGGTPSYASVQEEVKRAVKLKKAPGAQETLARLYREAGVTFEVDKYAAYFEDIRSYSEKSNKEAPKSPDTASLSAEGNRVAGR